MKFADLRDVDMIATVREDIEAWIQSTRAP